MENLIHFLREYPILSSAVQVAILGTFGEILSLRIRTGRWSFFGPGPSRLIQKIIVWAFLGISFKYAFAGFSGFITAICDKGFWFAAATEKGLLQAFSISLYMNLIFGPVMMLFHRWTDNFIEKTPMNWSSLEKAWKTLIWFWIPAHTITFSLPFHFQVSLAALWAVALGLILGFFARSTKK
jgi:hypothetical protein